MIRDACALVTVLSCALAAHAADPAYKLGKAEKPPEGVAAAVLEKLQTPGYSVSGSKGPVCQLWLAKKLPVAAKFEPSLSVKYPLSMGEFVAVLEVAKSAPFTDFRGQEIPAGVYTLRYGQQPQDGNHVGTSELADFLLAIPAKSDSDPKPIGNFEELAKRSAESAGATHPAIYSLLPPEGKVESAKLTHDDGKDLWIIDLPGTSDAGGKPVPLRLVVIGKAEG